MLKKEYRLRKNADFRKVYRSAKSVSTKYLVLYPKVKKLLSIAFFVSACFSLSVFVCKIAFGNYLHHDVGLTWFVGNYIYADSLLHFLYLAFFTLWAVGMGVHIFIDAPTLLKKKTVVPSDFRTAVITQLNLLKQQYDSGEITEEDYKQQRMECLKNSIK